MCVDDVCGDGSYLCVQVMYVVMSVICVSRQCVW